MVASLFDIKPDMTMLNEALISVAVAIAPLVILKRLVSFVKSGPTKTLNTPNNPAPL